jgi:hypothetical protein
MWIRGKRGYVLRGGCCCFLGEAKVEVWGAGCDLRGELIVIDSEQRERVWGGEADSWIRTIPPVQSLRGPS